ncbi:MAG: hypothetical protein BWY28_01675 [bacterium ADurb.Bin236]|nr:MAG: hypothetical protein BWY28_01675 [bacterium ADurb.Bin236]HOY63795.1 hypothetical protein [bacterium]HPN94440.1 hypothetical protein [bacterium]
MARVKWTKEKIVKRILSLHKLGEDLSNSNVKRIDGALVGAATAYFGNWSAALEAAGLDSSEVKKASQRRRNEKIKKWTSEKVLEEIRQKADAEKDLSYAYMKEKHPALVAAAGKYVTSWKKAVEAAGFDYKEVQEKGKLHRQELNKIWRGDLLLERLDKFGESPDERDVSNKAPAFHKLLIKHFGSWRSVVSALKKRRKERV